MKGRKGSELNHLQLPTQNSFRVPVLDLTTSGDVAATRWTHSLAIHLVMSGQRLSSALSRAFTALGESVNGLPCKSPEPAVESCLVVSASRPTNPEDRGNTASSRPSLTKSATVEAPPGWKSMSVAPPDASPGKRSTRRAREKEAGTDGPASRRHGQRTMNDARPSYAPRHATDWFVCGPAGVGRRIRTLGRSGG